MVGVGIPSPIRLFAVDVFRDQREPAHRQDQAGTAGREEAPQTGGVYAQALGIRLLVR